MLPGMNCYHSQVIGPKEPESALASDFPAPWISVVSTVNLKNEDEILN